MKTEAKNKLTLVERIMAKLNLGEAGKIQHFVDKQIKTLSREKDQLKRNIEIEQYNVKVELEKLEEQLEDAKSNAEDSYMNIVVENVATNALQEDYAKAFWARVNSAEKAVAKLEQQIKDVNESLDKTIKSINEEIEIRERFIAKLS